MRNKKIILLTFFICITPLFSACGQPMETKEVIQQNLPKVEVMEVKFADQQSFQVTGEITAQQSSNLTGEFKTTVENIFVKPGDKVKQNDLLIQLSSESIETAYQNSNSSLNLANASLNQTSGSAENNIESARLNLEKVQISYNNLITQNQKEREQAEANLKSSQLNYKLSLASGEKSLENAQQNLEKSKTTAASNQNSAENNLKNAITSANTTLQASINLLDQVLGISKLYENSNDSFEKNLGARNLVSKNNAKTELRNLMQIYANLSYSYETTYAALKQCEIAIQTGIDMLNQSETGNNFSETTLNGYITSFTNQLNSTRNNISSLTTANNNLNQTLSNNDASLTSAQNAVEITQKNLDLIKQETLNGAQPLITAALNYESILTRLASAEEDLKKQIESAKINYNNSLKTAELSKLGSKSALTNTLNSFEQNKINLEKLEIRAPFDGTIIDIPVKTGDEILPGKTLAQIENPTTFKIIAYLTPTQIKNIKIGDTVKIGTKSSDKIFAISQTVDPTIKKYKIEILHQNPYLHSGQTIPLQFTQIIQSESVIYLPLTAVHVNSDESFVWTVNEKNKTQKKIIQTGEISGDKIRILQGLELGDRVITVGARMFKTADIEVKITENK